MIEWKRHPHVVRAEYQMLVDGEPNGVWVRSCGHQTALRPYYVQLGSQMILERKYALLEDAKRAAILALEGEPGADGKPQLYIPGTERISMAEQARRKADAPLRPRVTQRACDHGLFGDDFNQKELFK
jgi:hypothetical protein